MLFNSGIFIFLFLPITAFLYFHLAASGRQRASHDWLVLASLFFYGWWNPVYLPLIATSMLVNYAIGRQLHRSDHPRSITRKHWLVAGIMFNLGLLGYFKYADFFIGNVASLMHWPFTPLGIALPLAISFFTFQQIAYLMDCHQADTPPYRFADYCLFVTFFPQLIAGPIVHHREMMPQFTGNRVRIDWDNIAAGLFIFTIGLFKKAVVADAFATWANAGFSADRLLTTAEAWGSSLSYTLQLYYDFSGYTDMAIGAALLFNIRLPINFNSPYRAANIREFWERWHITLSRWLRDYLYIPLGGNRKGPLRAHLNLVITFVLAGLWHGAAWTFVLWGVTHGLMLSIHRLWRDAGLHMPRWLAWPLFLLWLNATMVIFRAGSVHDAIAILGAMVNLHPGTPAAHAAVSIDTWRHALVFGAIALFAPNGMQLLGWLPYQGRLAFRPNGFFLLVTATLGMIALYFVLTTTGSEFLYFNF